jgi:hypothetical protein
MKIAHVAFILSIAFVPCALSAPFCVVTSYGKNCYYYDADACQDAARSANGMCVVNDEDETNHANEAPFCVAQSYGLSCYYYTADACYQAASASGGACVANPDK